MGTGSKFTGEAGRRTHDPPESNRERNVASHGRALTGARKKAAIEFLRLASSGKVREAYRAYVGPGFRHHNPFFGGDAESLMAAMEENAAQNPNKAIEVHHALEDGNLVAVHGRVRLKPEDLGTALVHIFRFDGNRIVELWDLGQPVPEDSPNQNGMF